MPHAFPFRMLWMPAISIVASVAWTIACGQDANFDLVTYHFYLGYSGFTPRLHLDYLPAGVYGYQSPLPFMPLYWLDSIGMPAIGIAVIYAAFHSLNLILLYLLTELVLGKPKTRLDRLRIAGLWLLGALAPVYWMLVGTSFADATTSVLVLAALWILVRSIGNGTTGFAPRMRWVALGGLIIGIATGARSHNGIFAAGMLAAAAFGAFPYGRQLAIRAMGVFTLAASLGWVVAYLPWGYRLYAEFGNPFFPLLNAVFRSSDFPAFHIPFLSFTPRTIGDVIALPYWMATDTPWVYLEVPLPDMRPLVFAAALLGALVMSLLGQTAMKRFIGPARQLSSNAAVGYSWSRRVILVFFAVSAVVWLATSANGRFGVALFLLIGPVSGVLLMRVLPARYAIALVIMVVLWQSLLQQVFFRQYRFNSMPWSSRYFDWHQPAKLAASPATFVSFGFQPASTLAPRLHPQSSHINLSGYPAIDAPGNERIRQLIGSGNRPLFGVIDVSRRMKFDPLSIKSYYQNEARLWGLDFTPGSCDLITLEPPNESWARFNAGIRMEIRYGPPAFLVCPLERISNADREDARREFEKFRAKLLRFGSNCPEFFHGPLGYFHTAGGWTINTSASGELSIEVDNEDRIYLRQLRPPHIRLRIGQITGDGLPSNDAGCRKWFSLISQLESQAVRGSAVQP